jgi:hypothetical protein
MLRATIIFDSSRSSLSIFSFLLPGDFNNAELRKTGAGDDVTMVPFFHLSMQASKLQQKMICVE